MQDQDNTPVTPSQPTEPMPTPTPASASAPAPLDTTPSPFTAQEGQPASPLQSPQETPNPVTPAFGPTPSAQPETQPGQMFSAPEPPATPPKKSKAPLIITLIVVLALLIGGAVAAYFFLMPKDDTATNNSTKTSQTSESDEAINTPVAAEKQAITAATVTDFGNVCEGNTKISNAKANAQPAKVAPFISTQDKWSIYLIIDDSLSADIATINTVMCIAPDTSTEKLAQSGCSVRNVSTQTTAQADAYSVTYNVTFYDPSTGEELSKTTATPTSTECPQYGSVEGGKVYIVPSDTDLKPALDSLDS